MLAWIINSTCSKLFLSDNSPHRRTPLNTKAGRISPARPAMVPSLKGDGAVQLPDNQRAPNTTHLSGPSNI